MDQIAEDTPLCESIDNSIEIPEYIQLQFKDSNNLGDCKLAQLTYEELQSAYTSDSFELSKNLLRVLYGNDDPDMIKFQCIKECNGVLFAKIDGKVAQVDFDDIKPLVLKDLHAFTINTLERFDPSRKMWKYSITDGTYTAEEMVIVEQLPDYFDKTPDAKLALYGATVKIFYKK